MWRPNDWHNPHENTVSAGYPPNKTISLEKFARELTLARKIVYEAGADAMLEALRKEDGVHFEVGEWTDDATFETVEPGTVVFIPDEAVENA